jgi:hypothetical protein
VLSAGPHTPNFLSIGKTTAVLGEDRERTVFRVPLLRGKSLDADQEERRGSRRGYVRDENGGDGLKVDRGD